MSRPALLFDMDGVLLHSYGCWRALCSAAATHFGAPPISDEAFEAGWGQGVEADIETWLKGCTVEEVNAFYDAHFLEHAAALRPEPGVREIFTAIAQRGQAVAVVTNTAQSLAEGILQTLALGEFAPERVVGARAGFAAKPAPDLLLEACRQLGCAPARVWMIGDSRYDAEAAAAAGIRFAGFRRDGEVRLQHLEEALHLR